MAESSKLELYLDPLTAGQKTALIGQPFVEGTGASMRLRLMTLPGRVTVSQPDPPEIERYNDSTPFVPTVPARPRTWEVTLDGAHAQTTAAILELMWGQLRVQTFNGSATHTRLADYSRPDGFSPSTLYNVALIGFEPPQDAIQGNPIRYLDGGSVTLLEVV